MAIKKTPVKAKKGDDYELPNVGNLKRTGRKGELMTDERRAQEVKSVKKVISSPKNKPAGLLKTIVNVDRMLNPRQSIKDFNKNEQDKPKRIGAAKKRLKELETRR